MNIHRVIIKFTSGLSYLKSALRGLLMLMDYKAYIQGIFGKRGFQAQISGCPYMEVVEGYQTVAPPQCC